MADRNGILAVERACFGDSWTDKMLFNELDNPLSVLVTEQRSERIVGFALGRVAADEGELYQIGVLPEYRKQHIAAAMLNRLHCLMRARGAAQCFLEVRSRNAAAIALYEKNGYEKISVRRGYYNDDDAVIYRKII